MQKHRKKPLKSEYSLTQTPAVDTENRNMSSGIIREYIPPIGGHNVLIVIDGDPTGLTVVSVEQSQIIQVTQNFPAGSEVDFYWSDKDDRYIFVKPESTPDLIT